MQIIREDVCYDVYVKIGQDHTGDVFGAPVAHFMHESNVLAYKEQLEEQGQSVRVQKAVLLGFSESSKEEWFMDYDQESNLERPRWGIKSLFTAFLPNLRY